MVHQTPDQFLTDAITNALLDLCIDAGADYASEYEEIDLDTDDAPIYGYLPNAGDLTRMARQPITIAAILDDLCRRMGITPPTVVTAALTDEPPY